MRVCSRCGRVTDDYLRDVHGLDTVCGICNSVLDDADMASREELEAAAEIHRAAVARAVPNMTTARGGRVRVEKKGEGQ